MPYRKLPRSFYDRATLEVAPDLLGKYVVYHPPRGKIVSRVIEVEAYIGQDDPACHASRGLTPRTRPMFGPPGRTYIYFIYGMYYCLNFVTESEGSPAAVLLRAAELVEGRQAISLPPKAGRDDPYPLSGPGKFCRALGLTTDQNDLDLTGDVIYLQDRNGETVNIQQSCRIGINVGTARRWRFYDGNSGAVTRPRQARRKG